MDENMQALCKKLGVDFDVLYAKVDNSKANVTTFTHEELEVLFAALEIAGGL